MDVIKDLAHSVAVMAERRVVEQGSVLEPFLHPRADITRDVVSTVVPQGLPRRVVDHIGSDGLWLLLPLDHEVTQQLVSDLIRDLDVSVHILQPNMTENPET